MKKTTADRPDRYNLSPKQATALRQISHHPWSVQHAQQRLQTTLGSLYHRGYVEVASDHFTITEAGEEALRLQTHADVLRSRAQYASPFAQVIRELAGYDPTSHEQTKQRKVVPMRRRASAA